MSLPPVKALDSSSHEDGQQTQDISSNSGASGGVASQANNNAIDSSNGTGANGQISQSQIPNAQGSNGSQNQQDEAYRYSQQQIQAQPQQQYSYYPYQPSYAQQFQNQYPYYQATNGQGVQSTQLNGGYPNYTDYSRINYVQNYAPVYQNQLLNNGVPTATNPTGAPITGASPAPGSGVPQNPQQITTATNSAIGQVQPVGSRPRVTTTMWEDEKTLCYQVDANGVSVVRRADNNMINGTKLLNVAHMTRGRRDGILKSEKVRDVVKIGSMHLKGVWIPFERALAMAQREGIVDLLYPLFVRDIKQVIQQGSTTQPQANPVASQWAYGQQPLPQGTASGLQPGPQGQQAQPSQQQAIGKVSPYLASGSIATVDPKSQTPNPTQATSQPQTQSAQQATTSSSNQPTQTPSHPQAQSAQAYPGSQVSNPQQVPQNYYNTNSVSQYGYYQPQYQYGYANAAGAANGVQYSSGTPSAPNTNASGSTTTAATSAGQQSTYQYPQYGYNYIPPYQTPQYDQKEEK